MLSFLFRKFYTEEHVTLPLFEKLYSYDGYVRENTLKQLKNCFEPELFPHLLRKLGDYVDINRQLAYTHLKNWSNRADFAKVCLTYFVEIQIVQKRERTIQGVEQLLFNAIDQNLTELKSIILNHPSQISRALYQYIKDHQKLSEEECIQLAQHTKDQLIRRDWINYVLQQEIEYIKYQFYTSKYVDVKKEIIYFLVEKNELDESILIEAFNLPHLCIVDSATFALKKRNFNFHVYFGRFPLTKLTPHQLRLRAYQIVFLGWDISEFFHVVSKIHHKKMIFPILAKAYKLKYLNTQNIIHFLQQQNLRYSYSLLKPIVSNKTIENMETIYSLCDEKIKIETCLEIYNDLSFWEKLRWLCKIYLYIETENEKQVIFFKLKNLLRLLQYQHYLPLWPVEIKQQCAKHFKFLIKYYDLKEEFYDEYMKINNILCPT